MATRPIRHTASVAKQMTELAVAVFKDVYGNLWDLLQPNKRRCRAVRHCDLLH